MSASTTIHIDPVPPFRLDLTAWALRRRPANVIDRGDGQMYRRAFIVGSDVFEVAAEQPGAPDSALLATVTGGEITPRVKAAARALLDRLFGLRIDLSEFHELANRSVGLRPLAARFRGVKPPRFPTLFETLANALACQQVSLTLGVLLLNRMTERFGPAIASAAGTFHAFPRPRDLAGLEPETFRRLGFSRAKGTAMIALARSCSEGQLDERELHGLDNEGAARRLMALRGIGRWSAEYALLRGLGRLDVFPGDDVGARKELARWLGQKQPLDYRGALRATEKWRPYAGLLYFHLLLHRLGAAGSI